MEHRLRAGDPVHVTVLTGEEPALPGAVTSSSRQTVELLLARPAPLGAAVKLERSENLFLGEVRSCRRDGESFAIGVELQHAIYNTEELARLARRLLDEDAR